MLFNRLEVVARLENGITAVDAAVTAIAVGAIARERQAAGCSKAKRNSTVGGEFVELEEDKVAVTPAVQAPLTPPR